MPDIVLATANARYAHTAFGLRCLLANMKTLAPRAALLEFTINERPTDMLERILDQNPKVVLLSVYIWNEPVLRELTAALKAVHPKIPVIIGGPEVSFEEDLPPIAAFADYIVGGESETIIHEIIQRALNQKSNPPKPVFINAPLPDLSKIALPYHLYTNDDIAHRVIYVESSRGCPYGCEFCLSSLDSKIRKYPEEQFLQAIDTLWNRGARKFKFLDRALNLAITPKLLTFFLKKKSEDLFLHFELVPDKLPEKIFELLCQFPKGSVQLEAGIQTFDQATAKRINRVQSVEKTTHNLNRLLTETGVHLHTDLVAGLPGESLESFGAGFDKLFAIGGQEIQLGILKRLRGAPIQRHSPKWTMAYRPIAPYDILSNKLINFKDMQRIKRFARYFDLVRNNGNFPTSSNLLLDGNSAFKNFMNFSDWIFSQTGQTASIALHRLAELIFTYCTKQLNLTPSIPANAIASDYAITRGRHLPRLIKEYTTQMPATSQAAPPAKATIPPRQKRRL